MSGRYWVENAGGHGVVVGPFNSAPTGENLTNLTGYPDQAQAQAAASQLSTVQAKAGALGGDIASGANSVVSDTLKPLFQAHIWLRVAEVVAGLVLIAIGLNSMLKGKPLSAVTSTAGLAAKVVPA